MLRDQANVRYREMEMWVYEEQGGRGKKEW
jgi:hypothetical protein